MTEMCDPLPGSVFGVADRVACVTGASSGLGRVAASVLSAHGARVVGVARRATELEEWQSSCSTEAAIVVADLGVRDSFGELAKEVSRAFGPPDILVNAAGINTRQAADP